MVVKWLKIPAVVVLLLMVMMSGCRGSALAGSSGVMSDHSSFSSSLKWCDDSFSSSSDESSALKGQHESICNRVSRGAFVLSWQALS
ncbi:hypothetical protein ACOSQ3_000965 [Xanthoceras sorbifolium]